MDDSEIIGETLNNVLRACQQKRKDEEVIVFGKLKNDFDRMKWVLEKDYVHEIMGFEAEYAGKSSEKSREFKEKGNKLFAKKSYMSAMDEYTKAIMHAPYPGHSEEEEAGDLLALALSNRSAALLHLQRYQQCIHDISASIELGFPKNMMYKLMDRRAKCYMYMKQPQLAISSFQMAAELLKTSTLDDDGITKWRNTINKQITQCHKINAQPMRSTEKQLPEVLSPPNSAYPNVYEGVGIGHHEENGRVMNARQKLRVSSVFADEKPYCAVALPDHYATNCYHCQKSCRAPYPCFKLSNVVFCGSVCRQEAWAQYHEKEYKFQSLLGPEWCGKFGHLAIRIANRVGYIKAMEYMKNVYQTLNDEVKPTEKGLVNGVYDDGYHAIYNMEVNQKKRLPDGLLDFHIFAVFLTKLLYKMGFFPEGTSPDQMSKCTDELVLISAFMVKNLEVSQCNAKEITEQHHPTDFENPHPAEAGIGIYPTAALFNHSCDPNADLNFYNNRLIIRATRTIEPGEEITIDYGLVFYKDPKSKRRCLLGYRYCFDCRCIACKDEWPLWRDVDAEIPQFKCEDCGRILRLGGKLIDGTSIRCSKCNSLQNLKERMGQLQVNHDMFAGAMNLAVNGKLMEALPGLEDYLGLMQRYIAMPWRDMLSCQAAVKQCYRLQANVREM